MSASVDSNPLGPALRELPRSEHGRVAARLRGLEMNTLFARAVLEQGAPGRAFADSTTSPSIVYVVHGYGMSLLFGDPGAPARDDRLLAEVTGRRRTEPEWLQVWPQDWSARLDPRSVPPRGSEQAPSAIERHTRVNFSFSVETYLARRPSWAGRPHRLARCDRATFAISGAVVPRAFWVDAEQFLARGAGFTVVIDGEPAALAFSAFVNDAELEIGIETREPYRGRGLATLACAALIDHCLERGLRPVWACRLENTASYRLAKSLGFVPVRQLPYYRLPPGAEPQV